MNSDRQMPARVPQRKNDKNGDELGILGYGCMRFRRKHGTIDLKTAERQLMSAIDAGVNYLDTAYLYTGSEKALGEILSQSDDGKTRRSRVKIATKLPHMMVKSKSDISRIFNASLKRLQTDHIEYYLIHNIMKMSDWERMKELGIQDFIDENKANGTIKNIGFSAHSSLFDFKSVIDDYDWDFCQIQYNYVDENFQAGVQGLKYAAKKGIPVVVMEPLRGGMLINKLPPAAGKIIDEYRDSSGKKRSPAEWALRWLWNQPEVSLVLSGMNEDEQITENINVASESTPGCMSDDDLAMIESVKNVLKKEIQIDCTGCAYCMPCPYGVDIPQCFSLYNAKKIFKGGISADFRYLFNTAGGKKLKPGWASACKKCGACEKKCPQKLPIVDDLDIVAHSMEHWWSKPIGNLIRKVLKR